MMFLQPPQRYKQRFVLLYFFTLFERSPLPFRRTCFCYCSSWGLLLCISEQQHAVIILFSLFAHSTEFFSARDQVLEQCLCDCHRGYLYPVQCPALTFLKRNALQPYSSPAPCSQPPPRPVDARESRRGPAQRGRGGVSGGPGEHAPVEPGLCAQARGGRGWAPKDSTEPPPGRSLVGKSCRVRGEFFPSLLRRASGLVSETSSVFLSVEAYGN